MKLPAVPPTPVSLDTTAGIESLARGLTPVRDGDKIAQLRFLAALTGDRAGARAALAALYPALRAPAVRLKLLAVAAELLADDEQPTTHAERVLRAMAGADA